MSSLAIYSSVTLILLTAVTTYLYRFYSNVRKYPPGPLPIPLFGNLLELIRKRSQPFIAIHETCRSYGKVSTFWFGPKPAIVINDLEIGKQTFNQINCSGRPLLAAALVVNAGTFKSFSALDYSIAVQFHRKVVIESIREMLASTKLTDMVKRVVSETVAIIKSRETSEPFSPDSYFPRITLRLLAELTFGQKYSFDDKQLESIEHSYDAFNNEVHKLILRDIIPITKYFLRPTAEIKYAINRIPLLCETSFEECKVEHKTGMCDNFASSLLTTRTKLLDEKRDNSKYLTDNDLKAILSTMFTGAIDTSTQAFNWLILLMSYYTEMQRKLRKEINDKIGNEICPKPEDRKNCHYVNAFIHEALRFRPIGPLGAPHRTVNETVISNYNIPKDTMLFVDLQEILNDRLYWSDPQTFSPQRFLDSSGLFMANRFPAYVAFGVGKRLCPGERMAVEMLFLELVCLLQATQGYQFELPDGPQNGDLDVWSYPNFTPTPKPYKIILKQTSVSE